MTEEQTRELLQLLRMIELNTAMIAAVFDPKQGNLRNYRDFTRHAAGEDGELHPATRAVAD
jgi:hypothetical protein